MATKKAKSPKDSFQIDYAKPYKASIRIWGKTYEAEGASISAALSSLKVPNPKGKSILVVSKDGATKERVLSPVATSRLFSHGLTREVALKHTSLLFAL
jgi:hypothetical protein